MKPMIATVFELDENARVERISKDPEMWVVRSRTGSCLSKAGQWCTDSLRTGFPIDIPESIPDSDSDSGSCLPWFESADAAHVAWSRAHPDLAVGTSTDNCEKTAELAPHIPSYTVIGYLWGSINRSIVFFAQTSDVDRAIEIAHQEAGSKYGARVLEWMDEETCRPIHYSPSAWGETLPEVNHRINMFQGIGSALHQAATDGSVYLPENEVSKKGQDNPSIRKPAPLMPWLLQLLTEKERGRAFNQMFRNPSVAAPVGMKSGDPEWDTWFDLLMAEANADAARVLAPAVDRFNRENAQGKESSNGA